MRINITFVNALTTSVHDGQSELRFRLPQFSQFLKLLKRNREISFFVCHVRRVKVCPSAKSRQREEKRD